MRHAGGTIASVRYGAVLRAAGVPVLPVAAASLSALRLDLTTTSAVDPGKGQGYAAGADWTPWSLRTGDEGLNPLTAR